jgi:hypothetical protein
MTLAGNHLERKEPLELEACRVTGNAGVTTLQGITPLDFTTALHISQLQNNPRVALRYFSAFLTPLFHHK